MRWNITDDGDHGTAGLGVWESVEITPIAPVATTGRPRATLAGGLLVFVAIVGAGLWPGMVAGPPADAGAQPCPTPRATPGDAGTGPSIEGTVAPGVPEPTSMILMRPLVSLFMPLPGEVVLGASVLVAGRVTTGRPRTDVASSSSLHVVIVVEGTPIGEADIPVNGDEFVGSLHVIEQARGTIAEIRISDGRRPDQILVQQTLVLGPGAWSAR